MIAANTVDVNDFFLTPFQQGQRDARDGLPCEPNHFLRIDRTKYATGHASITAANSSAGILGLSFVASRRNIDDDAEIVAPNSLGQRGYMAQEQFENWVGWQS